MRKVGDRLLGGSGSRRLHLLYRGSRRVRYSRRRRDSAYSGHPPIDQGASIQTFLPYPDFAHSAAVLDTKRLGKQRVETLQIFQVLVELRWNRTGAVPVIEAYQPKGWRTHPAVLGWRGYEAALLDYQRAVCGEWAARGFTDTCLTSTEGLFAASGRPADPTRPAWTLDPAVHRSHQSNLIRKDLDVYGPLFPDVPPDLDYLWPTASTGAPARPPDRAPEAVRSADG